MKPIGELNAATVWCPDCGAPVALAGDRFFIWRRERRLGPGGNVDFIGVLDHPEFVLETTEWKHGVSFNGDVILQDFFRQPASRGSIALRIARALEVDFYILDYRPDLSGAFWTRVLKDQPLASTWRPLVSEREIASWFVRLYGEEGERRGLGSNFRRWFAGELAAPPPAR